MAKSLELFYILLFVSHRSHEYVWNRDIELCVNTYVSRMTEGSSSRTRDSVSIYSLFKPGGCEVRSYHQMAGGISYRHYRRGEAAYQDEIRRLGAMP